MSILNIGTSALLTTQGALATTSNNISNVNTEGYTRQRVDQGTLPSNFQGGYYIGNGVNITDVERLYDEFLTGQIRSTTSQEQSLSIFLNFSRQLDDLLGSDELSLSNGFDSFFNAVQEVADDPTSLAARKVLLTEAEILANRFNTLDSQLSGFNDQINKNLEASVSDVNQITNSLAQMNQAIVEATRSGTSAGQPNELLDQRDKLLNDLSKLVSVSTVERDNGAMDVFIGNGQAVVQGNSAIALRTVPSPDDSTQLNIAYGSNNTNITGQLNGGRIGGLLNVRNDVIDPARVEIDTLAAGLATTINQQHQTGLTLDGNAGGNLFAIPDPLPTDWPEGAAADISIAFSDPRDLAVAFPVKLSTAAANSGTGEIAISDVDGSVTGFDAENVLTGAGSLQIQYEEAAGGYQITYGAGNTAFISYDPSVDSGKSFDLAGLAALPSPPNVDFTGTDIPPLTIKLSGTPSDEDLFTISNTPSGADFTASGDNRNALAMAELQIAKTLDPSGTGTPNQTFNDAFGNLVADVATRTQQADNSQRTQKSLLDQTTARAQATSGVNLDEEAANLIKYQQSYQAAAQIITVSNTIFDTLINSF